MQPSHNKDESPEVPARASVQDVARKANVSTATVSRVLNQPDRVSPEVRERVRQTIEALRYTPDGAARALRSRRTRTVGVVIPTLSVGVFAEGVEAMQIRLAEYGYTLLIASSQYDMARERHEINTLIERGVDGLLLVGNIHGAETYESIRSHRIPFLTTYICEAGENVPAVGIDNVHAAREVTEYLIGLGHRHFGVIANMQQSNDRSIARVLGIQEALAAAHIPLPSGMVYKAGHSLSEGRQGLRALMGADPALTAVVCTTDTLAIGALAEARAMGWPVPGKLSVTGFGGIELAAHVEPPLTTVDDATDIIGRVAVDHLMRLVQGEPIEPATRLPSRLVLRGSSGPAPGS
jgi:LacI family transcriptional regulator